MALIFTLFAATLASIVNLMTKKNLDQTGTSNGYLTIYFFLSFLGSLLVNPKIFTAPFSPIMFGIGCFTGFLMFLMMVLLLKALEIGPAALTFGFQNASAVFPVILLFFIFGPTFNFVITPTLVVGLFLVIGGLFWSAKAQFAREKKNSYSLKKWSLVALGAALMQVAILSMFHWRYLIIDFASASHPLLFVHCQPIEEVWFAPGIFSFATFATLLLFAKKEKRFFKKPEVTFGSIGGLLNGVVTFLLLLATRFSSSFEKGIIFPLFTVGVILFCSLWGKKLYHEPIHWPGLGCCISGIILGVF